MQRDIFKLDAAAIYDPRQANQRVIVYNINVPVDRLRNLETFELVRQVLETDFPPEAEAVVVSPSFQLSAVYVLVNTNTNEQRIWAGSFNPRGRELAQLTPFQQFNSETFVQYAFTHADPEYAANKLSTFVQGQDSVWRFERLISVVVSFQITVHLNHPVFVRHPQLRHHGRTGSTKKNWKTLTTVFD
jgi:hypothetical protein